ncbi:MAG: RNA polymerase sigma factor, partial [Planctomycetota bacterium]
MATPNPLSVSGPEGAHVSVSGAALLSQHGHFLSGLARALVRDPGAAEDLAQETLLDAVRESSAPGRSWLATVLRRKAANHHRSETRRRGRERVAARPEVQPDSLDSIERLDLVERLFRMVRDLDEPVREALLGRFYRGLSFAELAQESGVPASTLQSRVQRGLESLRERLDREEAGGREVWLGALAAFARLDPVAAAGSGAVGGGSSGAAVAPSSALAGSGTVLGAAAAVAVIGLAAWAPWSAPEPSADRRTRRRSIDSSRRTRAPTKEPTQQGQSRP